MLATAPIFGTLGSVSWQKIMDFPGPRAFSMTPVTSTVKDSGSVP